MKEEFNALQMAEDIASASGNSVDGLFMRKGDANQQQPAATISQEQHIQNEPAKPQKKDWMPDASLTADLPEFSYQAATYDADEIKTEPEDHSLKNLADEDAVESANEQKDEMVRINENLEAAKARFGIWKLQIPPGEHQFKFINAASDINPEIAAKKLDALFDELIHVYPEFIMEWNPNSEVANKYRSEIQQAAPGNIPSNEQQGAESESEISGANIPDDSAKVIIDKRFVPDVTWTDEDVSKIKKARTIELNIVEGRPIEFSEIKKADRNVVDDVINKYIRKRGDVVASLPASRYRCTFTGLSYPEVLDLSNSTDMNTVDAEMKKWTLCFNHMKNQSIGPWDEYRWYLDPDTYEVVRLAPGAEAPDYIDEGDVHTHTAFQDFLEKTSFMDVSFMIWKILCATCMDTEIIQIDCHASFPNGGQCTNHYDWIYAPAELVDMTSISEAVLEEMKITGEVSGSDAIMNNYRESFLVKDRTVKLTDGGIYAVFGHISAKRYLDHIYPVISEMERQTQEAIRMHLDPDPDIATKALNYTTLTVIKEFIVDTPDGPRSISDVNDMISIIENFSEIDWQSIGELVRMSMEPYNFKYSIRGIVCPKCHSKSSITIDNITMLLFIVARSLASVQVEFKTT